MKNRSLEVLREHSNLVFVLLFLPVRYFSSFVPYLFLSFIFVVSAFVYSFLIFSFLYVRYPVFHSLFYIFFRTSAHGVDGVLSVTQCNWVNRGTVFLKR